MRNDVGEIIDVGQRAQAPEKLGAELGIAGNGFELVKQAHELKADSIQRPGDALEVGQSAQFGHVEPLAGGVAKVLTKNLTESLLIQMLLFVKFLGNQLQDKCYRETL